MQSVCFCSLWLSAALLAAAAPEAPVPPQKPNIIFFLADDLGWNDVGFHGGEIRTPTLDRLANSGAKLEQFYVMPVCTPTRACLMTGRHPIRYGLQRSVIMIEDRYGLALDERTLPQALKEAGYRTAIFGKWHLGHHDPKHFPQSRGFDYQYGMYWGRIDYFSHEVDLPPHPPGEGLDWHRNGQPLRQEGYSTTLIGREAARLVTEHDSVRPLFLYVAFNAPHAPMDADPEYLQQYAHIKNAKRRTFAAMVTALDDAVAEVMAAVEKKGWAANTLVLFSSDNGGRRFLGASNSPLRGEKATVYEGGVRVPAFALWPGRLKPGTVVNEPIHMVDMFPTLLKLACARLEQPKPLDGLDVWPTIAQGRPSPRKEMLINFVENRGAIRVGNWKLVAGEGAQMQLFDLAHDPNETANLAEQEPAHVRELKARLDYYAKQAVAPLETSESLRTNFTLPKVLGEE